MIFRPAVVATMIAASLTPISAQQQQPDPAMMQKAIGALSAQRNAAMDQAAQEAIRSATLAEENAKLKAEIEALKKPADK